jgi:hypothetical protein
MRSLLMLLLAGCTAASAQPDADGVKAFATVYKILMHPRCMNCHPAGDAPLQFDTSTPHAMNITRRSEANGVPCAACHRSKNNPKPNQPPGAPNWHLPPAANPMIFEGRTPKQLCEQLKNPQHTGGKDLKALLDHVAHDKLVGWGWDPGPGRTPVPIPRAEAVRAMEAWIAAGAPCPE